MEHGPNDDYYHHLSYQDVSRVVQEFHRRVRAGQFYIAQREDKNLPFIREYNLASKERQARILLSVCVEDYAHTILSRMEGNEGQQLHVFIRRYPLHKMMEGTKEVWVYVKVDLISGSNQNVIIVPFHEAESVPESFLFQ